MKTNTATETNRIIALSRALELSYAKEVSRFNKLSRTVARILARRYACEIASGLGTVISECVIERLTSIATDRSIAPTETAHMIGKERATYGAVARALLAFARDGKPLKPIILPHHPINRGLAA